MPSFTFTARDSAGRTQKGTRNAASAGELAAQLRSRGWLVMEVQLAVVEADRDGLPDLLNPRAWLGVRSIDVELGLQQIAVMLRSGLPLLQALDTSAEHAERLKFRRILRDVSQRVRAGSSMADAMARHECFGNLAVQLTRVGEQTGNLDQVLEKATEAMERRRLLIQQLVTALTYPTITFLAAIGVTIFMVVFLIPKLEVFLASISGKKLPAMTQVLVDVSKWTKVNGLSTLVVMGVLGVLAIVVHRTPAGRLWFDRNALNIPLIGKVMRVAGTALFARAFGIMNRSGVTVLDGLRTIENLGGNYHLNSIVGRARTRVFSGGGLAESLDEPNGFMPMLPRMMAVGESAGTLDDVLDEVAKFYENQLQVLIRRLSALVEPAIIIFVGGVVGYVYIAFFLALYGGLGGKK